MKVKNYLLTRLSGNLNQGFTMIELLVVTMIIGILSGIALPTFLALINKAKSLEGQTSVSQLGKKEINYYEEFGRFAENLEELGFTSPKETENYYYTILSDNNYGAIHVALSKKFGVKSYINVVYFKDGSPRPCESVEIPLMHPVNPIALGVVLSNPTKYCR